MTYDDLEEWEAYLMKEIVHRRSLGGYSTEAATILQLLTFTYQLVQDMKRKMPKPKKKEE